MLLLFLSMGMTWAQKSLLTQQKLTAITNRAAIDAEKENCYTADAIRQFLNYYKIDGYALPDTFPNRDDEKEVVKFMQKVCDKGKTANDSDKKLWKPYYTAYLIEIYTQEEELIAQREKEEQERQDSIVRNSWDNSDTWKNLLLFCNNNYSLTDSTIIYGEFIKNNGLSIDLINEFYYAQIHKEQQIFKDIYKLSSKYGYGGFYENFMKDSLFQNYKTILKEIKYYPNNPELIRNKWRFHGGLPDSVLYPFFQKDKIMVGELRRLKQKYVEIDTSTNRYLWMICNSGEFRRRVNVWGNNSTPEYPSNGVIKDTIKPVWNRENLYIINIPYFVEDGTLIPNGVCIVRQVNQQPNNATGELFEIYTYDVSMTVNVDKGMATSVSVKGYVCQWDENTAAGQGKKSEFERRKAIRMAKPVVKKKINVTSEADIRNFPMIGGISVDLDNMKTILTYGCSNDMWNTLNRMGRYDNVWDYLRKIKSRRDILAAYIYTGNNLFLQLANRPLAPIDFSNMQ